MCIRDRRSSKPVDTLPSAVYLQVTVWDMRILGRLRWSWVARPRNELAMVSNRVGTMAPKDLHRMRTTKKRSRLAVGLPVGLLHRGVRVSDHPSYRFLTVFSVSKSRPTLHKDDHDGAQQPAMFSATSSHTVEVLYLPRMHGRRRRIIL